MSLNTSRRTVWPALVLALCVAGQATADDRDFLRERRARPNILFVLDSSGSMVGSPEIVTQGVLAAPRPYGMVPGAGDDPYSRMGIAKTVLGQFLGSTDANFALAWYAQALPEPWSWKDDPNPINAVPRKHWVYEAKGADHFRLIEPQYAYRIGYNERLGGELLPNPAGILKDALIGYTPWFDPVSCLVPLDEDGLCPVGQENPNYDPPPARFGPIRAFDVDYTMPFDRLPIYFGTCFTDPRDGSTVCSDGYTPRFVFPFYTLGERDLGGVLIPETWAYDFERCDPIDDFWDADGNDIPDDPGACRSRWLEPIPASDETRQHMRRVKLEMPETVAGNPNHPLGITDPDGVPSSGDENPIGNQWVGDFGVDNYDGGADDQDPDGNPGNDWALYVDPVEQQRSRVCNDLLPTSTPTATPTLTPIPPTATPTPLPANCGDIQVTNLRPGNFTMQADLSNGTVYQIEITRTVFTWLISDPAWFVDGYSINQAGNPRYWGGANNNLGFEDDFNSPSIQATSDPAVARVNAGAGTSWHVDTDGPGSGPPSFGYHEVCLDFTVIGGGFGGADLSCPDICSSWDGGDTPTPTATPTITNTPTITPTPSNTPTNTDTPTPDPFFTPPTATPIPPTATVTPIPPTATETPIPPTATETPIPPTATETPIPPTATETPIPPTATETPIPPTATDTPTPVPPTSTPTNPPTATPTPFVID